MIHTNSSAYAIQADIVVTSVFQIRYFFNTAVNQTRLSGLSVSTLVLQCLTSHVLKQTLILAQTLTSDPYKPGPLKTRLSVHGS